MRGIGRDEEDSEEYEDERNLAVGSLQKFMGNIAKIQKTITRKPSPVPPGELARDSLRAIRRRTRKSQSEEREKEGLKQTLFKKAQERALKKLVPAPGWKPFGTLTKRKLHGKDW